VTAISEREARTSFIQLQGGGHLSVTLKCGATTICDILIGPRHAQRSSWQGIHEAWEATQRGHECHLFVRHPLDRLVSAWKYFTTKHNTYIKDILEFDADIHDRIQGNRPYRNISLPEWWEAASQVYNKHWVVVTDYNTYKGEFVPDRLYPLEALGLATGKKLNATRHDSWESYYDKGLRDKVATHFEKDIELFEKAKEEWNGRAPTVFRGYREYV
jgi:hypothetical protein